MASNQLQKLRQQQNALVEACQEIIEQSTAEKLKRNHAEQAKLRESIESLERIENRAKHSIPPSAEEQALWTEIRRLSDEEAGILHRQRVPEKFIRPDALEFFQGDIAARREKLETQSRGLKFNQSAGPRYIAELNEIREEESSFATRVKPVCQAGIRLFEIRQQKAELSTQRDELKAAREAAGLATV